MNLNWLLFRPLSFLFICTAWCATPVVAEVDFRHDVRPILSDRCFACHGPDKEHREADLRLDQFSESLIESSVIQPGKPEESELLARITSDDPDMRMPPADTGDPLTPDEINVLREWIATGATWQRHWAFESPQRPPTPDVDDAPWPTNEIDYFTLAEMQHRQLKPSAQASPETLVRRLHLDLIGLPPTLDQVDAFVADSSAAAYERLVDQLLDDPRFGERMALAWLDQARYADTNGYSIDGGRQMWLWRDWVIDAYNRNLPFDQFLTEQLAGDLLPNATEDQRIASGFNRNHMITHEGGTIPEENLVNYVADRVKTTSEVFLGLTMACAQCHDHKFDPISQEDYYRFFAFFNTVNERGLDGNAGINAVPKIKATSVFGKNPSHLKSLQEQLVKLEAVLDRPLESQSAWETKTLAELSQRGDSLQLHPVEVIKVTSPNRGADYEVKEDGTVFVPNGQGRSPSISTKLPVDNVTGLRLVFTPHETFPNGGLGTGSKDGLHGSFLLTSFTASATNVASDQVDLYKQLRFNRVTASAQHPEHPPQDCLDERDHNGWSPHPNNQVPQHISFMLDEPLDVDATPYLTVMLVWGRTGYGGVGGQYRLYAMTGNDDGTNVPAHIQAILRVPAEQRTEAQAKTLQDYHTSVAPELEGVRHRIANLKERIDYLSQPHEVMVMQEAEKPRETFVLSRGQYDQPTERVTPAIPGSLFVTDEAYQANRLGLTQWMTNPQHPLTSRVAVNRVWQLLFGNGLVRTSADFGSQGTPPTHPALLDYLAVDFVESGWDVKRLIKRIVMSSTYRQDSSVSPEHALHDPQNRWLSRGPRFRLPAELIRDQALAASGLLSPYLGGPSVKPYQPPALWKEISHYGSTPATSQVFVQDHGVWLYRRSLYTYWKRTAPPPAMLAFDAPNREFCTVQRIPTNTPLQALVLLNDPQFVEAGRALGERILQTQNQDTERLVYAFRLVTSRRPDEKELKVLRSVLEQKRNRYANDPDAAAALLRIGEHRSELEAEVAERAAWASVGALLLNLSETITRG